MMRHRRLVAATAGIFTVVVLVSLSLGTGRAATRLPDLTPTAFAYLPLIASADICPTDSANQYQGGTAHQVDQDDPVRPAYEHADKNIELRGYTPNTDPGLQRGLIDYGSDDPTQPPQFATLFDPWRVPTLSGFYQVHHWNWAPSPDPGSRAGPILNPPVTALGLATVSGETLHVPVSGYHLDGGMEVLVLFADQNTVALRYTRDDSSAPQGYTLHIDNICTDPNLLALYNALDDPSGPRYRYPNSSYPLPNLYAGQPIGVARGSETVIAIADTGTFQDPRSLNEWWQIRPGYRRNVDDAYYAKQWALERVRAPMAWGHSTGAGTIIAVLDTGADLDHPDLQVKVLTDLDKDFVNDDLSADDDHGHGTHVSGIAAATTDNALGVAGLGWEVSLLPLKVLDGDGNGDAATLAAAIDYAVEHGADVINMSLGGAQDCGWPLEEAVREAYRSGVILVAAAGNNLGPVDMFPANCEHVLGVAATDEADAWPSYSNHADHVSVAAPGSGIYSTIWGGGYGDDSGTSMATPHVAGLAALLMTRYPSYTPDEVASAILDNARDLGSPGWDEYHGCGRIDAYAALTNGARGLQPLCLENLIWSTGRADQRAAASREPAAAFAPGEIIVEFQSSLSATSLANRYQARMERLPTLGVWRLRVPKGLERTILAQIRADPAVLHADLNYVVVAQ